MSTKLVHGGPADGEDVLALVAAAGLVGFKASDDAVPNGDAVVTREDGEDVVALARATGLRGFEDVGAR